MLIDYFRQLTKFEQRAKKLKVDDSDVHRIRKNVQTLSSNHSTMYNKLKEYCNESAELKKTLRKLTETAKRLGKPTQNTHLFNSTNLPYFFSRELT